MNLARKYRPSQLDQLLGQDNIVKILREALKKDQIAPAYLFSGPKGVGKTSTARIFARAASCLAEDLSLRPCGECRSCLAFKNFQNMDVMEIDGASHTGVDDVRRIIESVAYRPNFGKRNVYIIDEVHMLSNAAFNALLKTLEEPPPHALFLFATTEPEKLPSTILSRVQRLELRRLSEKAILENLNTICKAESIQADEHILDKIAAAADGALRDAQTLLEQMLLLSGSSTISPDVVDTFLGTIGSEAEIELLSSLAHHDAKRALLQVKEFFEKGKDLIKLNQRLLVWCRALLITKTTAAPELVGEEIPAVHLTKLLQNFEKWSVEDCDRLFEVLYKSHERMKQTDLPLISFETALIRATRLTHTEDLARLLQKIELDEPKQMPAPQQNFQAATFEAPAKALSPKPKVAIEKPKTFSYEPQNIETAELFLAALKKARPSLWALAKCAEEIKIGDNEVLLKLPKSHFAYAQLTEKLMFSELKKVIEQLGGRARNLQVEEAAIQLEQKPAKRTDFIVEAKQKILEDEQIQNAVEMLGGKIKSVTVEGIKT